MDLTLGPILGYERLFNAGNRTGEQIDDSPGQAAHNTVNQVTSITAAGPTRFKGWISQTGTVTVAGATATMTSGTNFTGVVGTNVVSVVATD